MTGPAKPSVWLVGDRGMLGRQVRDALSAAGTAFVGTDREVDITDPDAVESSFAAFGAGVVINCAAYTAVDRAEDEPEAAFRLNADGPRNLAAAARRTGARLIHVSTDYVFPGTRDAPLSEDEPTGPVGVYGRSKLAGEQAVDESGCRFDIVRTAWLYGEHGPNFVATMLRLMNEREVLKVVDDQVGSPTSATDLAAFMALLASRPDRPSGIYHYSNEGRISWYEFARAILEEGTARGLVGGRPAITPCGSGEYPTKAARPAFSLLSKDKAKRDFGRTIPEWRDSLRRYLDVLASTNGESS